MSSAQASAQFHALTGMTPAQASPSPAPCIEVENLSVRFGAQSMFDGLGFTVAQDEFVCLLGPSGCGKSTLLRAIAELVQPVAGGVHVGDMTPGQDGGALRLGMMFKKPLLLTWRNTLQNVALPTEIALGGNAVSAADLARARSMLSLVRLEGFESAYPHQLSGGIKQRAALARALMSDPNVLLLDEPLGALDQLTRDALNEELLTIWRNADTPPQDGGHGHAFAAGGCGAVGPDAGLRRAARAALRQGQHRARASAPARERRIRGAAGAGAPPSEVARMKPAVFVPLLFIAGALLAVEVLVRVLAVPASLGRVPGRRRRAPTPSR
ncbi:MAG: ABC transporter ATP-binding protein [Candidatus Protistobacter heckmanni]|nr:ABC transporter ATP-binding protein [Candidatus Protistobacter heckmanni]